MSTPETTEKLPGSQFGKLLRTVRMAAGLKQREAAEIMGCAYNTLANAESSPYAIIGWKRIEKFADHLNMPPMRRAELRRLHDETPRSPFQVRQQERWAERKAQLAAVKDGKAAVAAIEMSQADVAMMRRLLVELLPFVPACSCSSKGRCLRCRVELSASAESAAPSAPIENGHIRPSAPPSGHYPDGSPHVYVNGGLVIPDSIELCMCWSDPEEGEYTCPPCERAAITGAPRPPTSTEWRLANQPGFKPTTMADVLAELAPKPCEQPEDNPFSSADGGDFG